MLTDLAGAFVIIILGLGALFLQLKVWDLEEITRSQRRLIMEMEHDLKDSRRVN